MQELGVEADRAGLVEEWRAVPQGWYVGGAAFREWMAGLAEKPLRHARPGSLRGEVKREHGEADAERLVGVGLPLAGLGDTDLAKGRKGERHSRTRWRGGCAGTPPCVGVG